MTHSPCTVEGCHRPLHGRGYCSMHWKRWRKHGDPHGGTPHFRSPEAAFAARTEWDGNCLVWIGGRSAAGYGAMGAGGRKLAHRYAWERVNGTIPGGMHIDHTCWNRACVNVSHLRLATRNENAQNLSRLRPDNTSGYRGVYWIELRNSWAACAKVDGKQKLRYGFSTPEEASVVAQAMRDEYYGEFAGAKSIGPTAVRNHRENMETR